MTQHYSTHLVRHLRRVIGRKMQELRMRQGITLAALAQRTDMPEGQLDSFELGKRQMDFAQLVKIACALRVEVRALLA